MNEMAMNMSGLIRYNGDKIWIKPVCDFFQINVQNQYRKIKNDHILKNLWTFLSTDSGEIDKNGRILLTKKGFVRWIQIINPKTVAENLRKQFLQFQEIVIDYLFGTAEEHEKLLSNYTRLKRLRRLHSKVASEIRRVENIVSAALDKRYLQKSIQFPDNNERRIG